MAGKPLIFLSGCYSSLPTVLHFPGTTGKNRPNTIRHKQAFSFFSYLLHYPQVLHLFQCGSTLGKGNISTNSQLEVSVKLKQVLLYSGDNPCRALTREMLLQMWESVPLENAAQVLLF